MKRLALALTAVAAFTGSALAADMAPRTYTKAPAMVAPVASWTGCYIGAGGGGAMTNNDHNDVHRPVTGGAAGQAQSDTRRAWLVRHRGGRAATISSATISWSAFSATTTS